MSHLKALFVCLLGCGASLSYTAGVSSLRCSPRILIMTFDFDFFFFCAVVAIPARLNNFVSKHQHCQTLVSEV